MNIELLDEVWVEQKRFLKNGLLDGTFWDKSTGLALSYHVKSRDDFVALFSGFIDQTEDALSTSGMPAIGRSITVAEKDLIMLVIKHNEQLFQGLAIDPNEVNLGLLYNVALPKAIEKTKLAMA